MIDLNKKKEIENKIEEFSKLCINKNNYVIRSDKCKQLYNLIAIYYYNQS